MHLSNAKASASQELLRQKAEVEAARLELKGLHSQVRFRRIFWGKTIYYPYDWGILADILHEYIFLRVNHVSKSRIMMIIHWISEFCLEHINMGMDKTSHFGWLNGCVLTHGLWENDFSWN